MSVEVSPPGLVWSLLDRASQDDVLQRAGSHNRRPQFLGGLRQHRHIEEVVLKVKGLLRKVRPGAGKLVEAMGKALDAVSTRDANGFFEHYGYHASDQSFW